MAEEPTVRIPIRTCTQCGKPIVQGMTECFACGTPIEKEGVPAVPRRCPTCGKELTRGGQVCSLCGTRLRPDRVKKTPPEETPPIPPLAPNAATDSPPQVETAQKKPALLPSRSILSRVGMSLGTLIFLLLGFSLGKLLFTGSGSDGALETPSPVPSSPTTTVTGPAASSPTTTSVALSSPATGPPLVRSLGQVVTAEQLLPIRTFGTGADDPNRSTKILRERVEEFLPSIRSLYNEKFAASAQLLGTVVLEFTIAADGHVTEALTHPTTLESPLLLQVIQSLVREWQFEPISVGDTLVFYPLLFVPQNIDPTVLMGLTEEHLPGRYQVLGIEPLSVLSSRHDDASTVGKVSPGLRIDVVGAQGEWLTILSPKGKTGYVQGAILSTREDAEP